MQENGVNSQGLFPIPIENIAVVIDFDCKTDQKRIGRLFRCFM